MICNLNGGRIYKGSIAQIDVYLYPPCQEAKGVVANFYTVSGQSIEKTDISVTGGIGTVLFQPVELETFEDGVLRYNVSYEVDGVPFTHDYETRWVIKTPIPYEPIDYVSSANVEEVVSSIIASDSGVVSEIQTQIDRSISGKADTSAVTQSLATKQDKLTAGSNIRIANNVISVTGMPDTSSFVNSGQVQTQINNSITGKQDTLVSGTNIKTVNSQSILGSGNIVITSATPTNYSAGTNIAIVNNVISVTGITVPTSNTAFTNDAKYVTSGDVQTQINNSTSGKADTTAVTQSLATKQDKLVSGTNIKTINNQSILGSGNIEITSATPTTYTAGSNIDITNDVISVTGITVPTSNTALTNDAGYITSQDIPTSNTAFTNEAGYVNSGQVQTQIDNSISGLSPYTAGTNIEIEDNVISVTGITSYTGITSQEVINALGYTPCKVTAMTQTQYSQLETKDANTIYGITGD